MSLREKKVLPLLQHTSDILRCNVDPWVRTQYGILMSPFIPSRPTPQQWFGPLVDDEEM